MLGTTLRGSSAVSRTALDPKTLKSLFEQHLFESQLQTNALVGWR